MDNNTVFILFVIFIAFVFEFINGFHDAANSIATIVTTKVLTPRQAVLWAAFFNFIAFFIFDFAVAQTIGQGLIDTQLVDPTFLLAALIGAIVWNVITWYFGLPSSSSHALIGGLTGAALIKGGFASLKLNGFIKVALGIFLSPVIGLIIGLGFFYFLNQLIHYYNKTHLLKVFKGFQLLSSALLSMTHGGNDAQKTMGIITLLLFSSSWMHGTFYVPFWVILACHTVIAFGTLFGGWRIVRTMGLKITKLNTMKGCAAEAGAALAIFSATEFGIPVSTTQTVTGSITGVGLLEGIKGKQWKVLKRIFLSWLLTIPAAALISSLVLLFFYLVGNYLNT